MHVEGVTVVGKKSNRIIFYQQFGTRLHRINLKSDEASIIVRKTDKNSANVSVDRYAMHAFHVRVAVKSTVSIYC